MTLERTMPALDQKPESTPAQGMTGLMMSKKEAARLAGQWWAARLSDEFADHRSAFAASVEKHVLQELNGECYWDWFGERHDGVGREDFCRTEHDYDPHYCLVPAMLEAIPDVPFWKLKSALPIKHCLNVCPDVLKPKEGYGNWTPNIRVLLGA
jgi:hypothetical protein